MAWDAAVGTVWGQALLERAIPRRPPKRPSSTVMLTEAIATR
jgi:hypothetical protein